MRFGNLFKWSTDLEDKQSDLKRVLADGLNNFKLCPLVVDVVAAVKKLELSMVNLL